MLGGTNIIIVVILLVVLHCRHHRNHDDFRNHAMRECEIHHKKKVMSVMLSPWPGLKRSLLCDPRALQDSKPSPILSIQLPQKSGSCDT